MPIGNKDDRWVFDDMDAIDVSLPDAPRPDELVIALALSAGGRPNARVRKPTVLGAARVQGHDRPHPARRHVP